MKQFLDGKPYENEAKQQLGIIKEIENHATATPWNRSNALWKMLKGESVTNVRDALRAMEQPV